MLPVRPGNTHASILPARRRPDARNVQPQVMPRARPRAMPMSDATIPGTHANTSETADHDAYPLLLIDAGNSRVKWAFRESEAAPAVRGTLPTACLEAGDPSPEGVAASADRHNVDRETERSATLRVWHTLASPTSIWISNVAGASVAATLSDWLAAQWPDVPRHTIRAMTIQCGVTNHYVTPERLGSDRWAGMIGARTHYPNEALLIATLGTATTLDAINADGHFVGGLIAPGWSLMMRSLGEHTAQLPTLSPGDAGATQSHSTPDAMQHAMTSAAAGTSSEASADTFAQATPDAIVQGCKLAQVGLITQAWQQWQDALGTSVRCVLAGGAAADVGPALAIAYTRNDNLVLDGLARIATQQGA